MTININKFKLILRKQLEESTNKYKARGISTYKPVGLVESRANLAKSASAGAILGTSIPIVGTVIGGCIGIGIGAGYTFFKKLHHDRKLENKRKVLHFL